LWRIRELTRLKRDAELREAIEKEKAEVVRWRNMSEEERRSEDARLSQDKPVKEKEKWRFMQKYYHKGVFYMDEDSVKKEERDVRTLEFSAPTLEDHVDKEKLPAIMQVKKFGMRGRTKYTHLVDQDTTRFGPDAHQPDARVMQSYLNKRGGVGDLNDAGRRKKITRHET
jgi:microfibrillar-associated protein 1